MTCKKGTDESSKSHLTSLVENEGLLPAVHDGQAITNEDRKLLMSIAIPTETQGRRENLAVKNLMDLVITLVETITKYVIKSTRKKINTFWTMTIYARTSQHCSNMATVLLAS